MNFQELQKVLKGLEFTDLVNLYLEAKIGKPTSAEDLLPADAVEALYSLEEAINKVTDPEEMF